jgi:hypothetical protein
MSGVRSTERAIPMDDALWYDSETEEEPVRSSPRWSRIAVCAAMIAVTSGLITRFVVVPA